MRPADRLRRVTAGMAAASIAMFVAWAWQSRWDGCNADPTVDADGAGASTAATETPTPWRGEEPHEPDEPDEPHPIAAQYRRDAEAWTLCGLCPKRDAALRRFIELS